MMKINNILFDLDGTIIDPKVGITFSMQYAMKKLGFDKIPKTDDLVWCIGPPLQDSFAYLLKTSNKVVVDEAVRLYRINYNRRGIHQLKLYNGILDTLRCLKNKGHNIYIATSKPRVMAVNIIENLAITSFFNEVYGSELDGTRTAKKDLISYLLEKENISPDDTIMVGDRRFDIIGAKGNSLTSCGVCYGYGSKDELISAGADFLVDKPVEIPHILKF